MKVAFATKDGVRVNEHFGRCGLFTIYEVNEKGFSFLEIRKFAEGRETEIEETKGKGEVHDLAVWDKVKALSDCKIIYMTEIGHPSTLPESFCTAVKHKPTPSTYALEHTLSKVALFVPKRMLTIITPDEMVECIVNKIMEVNRTGNTVMEKFLYAPLKG